MASYSTDMPMANLISTYNAFSLFCPTTLNNYSLAPVLFPLTYELIIDHVIDQFHTTKGDFCQQIERHRIWPLDNQYYYGNGWTHS